MLMFMSTSRLIYLDNIKGILIMLVIIGHAIQFCSPDYEENFFFRFIYSFHMPLFFFISGYLANRGKWDSKMIRKRFAQLLFPFVTWAFISPLLKTGSLDWNQVVKCILYPDNGLWFIYNLFVYVVVFNVADYLHYKHGFKHCIVTAFFYMLLCMLMLKFHTKFNCSQLCYHIVFYASGFYYRQMKFVNKYSFSTFVILGSLFLMSVPFWVTNGSPLFYKYINLGTTFAYLYRYGVQIVAMLLFYGIGYSIMNHKLLILQELGTSTLGIYAVQFIVIHYGIILIPVSVVWLKTIIIFCVAIPISYFLVLLIRKVKYLRLFLIGEK